MIYHKGAAYKVEVHEAQATIVSDLDSGRGASPITTSNIRAALKELNQKLRKAPDKDALGSPTGSGNDGDSGAPPDPPPIHNHVEIQHHTRAHDGFSGKIHT